MNLFRYLLIVLLPALALTASARAVLNNNYGTMSEITFQLYDENVPSYPIPENLKSTEEVLMYEVLHAVWVNNKWIAYTLNKNLLGTFKVGSPALLDNGTVKKIFFVANFPGTRGGTDIYSAEYTNGAWGKPKNMGDVVNTAYNEANPGLLTEKVLTFSSNGIIKKYDLGTSALESLSSAPQPSVTVNTQPAATNVQETKPVTVVSAPVTPSPGFQSLGKKTTDAMKAAYPNAIQLGVFGNPNWNQLEQFAGYGKLITFKNEKDLNPVWVTGFKSLAEAEAALQQIRMVPGFEKAYVLK